ncbi:hypothetical protein PUN28_013355 [Cardiocondyla obscurior]|uniref:Uncharacterized protein n=1 Tax=Cardiocondyla obscurior TaxID=286306 RepID=A0AAW2FA24_9HYME
MIFHRLDARPEFEPGLIRHFLSSWLMARGIFCLAQVFRIFARVQSPCPFYSERPKRATVPRVLAPGERRPRRDILKTRKVNLGCASSTDGIALLYLCGEILAVAIEAPDATYSRCACKYLSRGRA